MGPHAINEFPGKILLAGEYAVLHGSMALLIPCFDYFGSFELKNSADEDESLKKLLESKDQKFYNSLNWEEFERDLKEGLRFESTIPQGMGLGSSGALCAAFYFRYIEDPTALLNLTQNDLQGEDSLSTLESVQKDLAKLESVFHGTSSGLDPLVCLFKKPLLKSSSGTLQFASELNDQFLERISLLEGRGKRETSKLVPLFLEFSKQKPEIYKDHFVAITNQLVHALLGADLVQLEECWKLVANFEKKHMEPMMQAASQLKSDNLKLCGAGGGGMYLTLNKEW